MNLTYSIFSCTSIDFFRSTYVCQSINFSQSFRDLGYTWIDPKSLNIENDIEDNSSLIEEIDKVNVTGPVKVLKQSTLLSFLEKIILWLIIVVFSYNDIELCE